MGILEAVYLSNVILYIESIETIIKLIKVNKKCQEATKIIRYCNKRKLKESYERSHFYYGIAKNIFDIFPNIETIRCEQKDILNNLELFDKVKQIELFDHKKYQADIKLPQEIKDKIIELDIACNSLGKVQLNEFPNVRKVKVSYILFGIIKGFLGNKNVRLKELIIETRHAFELNFLKKFENIKNKIIKLECEISKEMYQKLKQFANVYSIYPIDEIDIKDSIYISYHYNISNKYDIDRFYDLTLFTKCRVKSNCDLRKCEFLEEIKTVFPNQNEISAQIEGLNHLKRIEYIKKVDCLPTTVSHLSFNPSFNCEELLEKDIDCFNNIKEVVFKIDRSGNNENTKIMMNFKNCTKLALISDIHPWFGTSFDNDQTFEIPMGVKELVIDKNFVETQIKEIGKITGLKKLEINSEVESNKVGIEEMFDKLKELEWLKTNCIDGIKLPLSLTFLDYKVNNNIDLSQYTKLKEIKMGRGIGNCAEVKLPNKINKLYIEGNINVINSNEIEVGTIILEDAERQLSQWKSNNIFVLEGFNPFTNYNKSLFTF